MLSTHYYMLFLEDLPQSTSSDSDEIGGSNLPTSNVTIGGSQIKTSVLDNGKHLFNFKFVTDDIFFSDSKLYLFGIPLTIYKDASGKNYLAIYTINDPINSNLLDPSGFSESDHAPVYKGTKMTIYEDGHNKIMAAVKDTYSSANASGDTLFGSLRVAFNEDNILLGKQISGNADSITTMSFSGVPIAIASIDDHLYLTCKLVT